jgi:hypothetical protein
MSNTEFLQYTSMQVHNTICALLPEVAENFVIAIYILDILFYAVLFCTITKGIAFIINRK